VGFARALELGVASLELDCGVTKDGVVVVTHDADLNPDITRDASGHFLETPGPRICALSFRELQSYDVGRLKPGTPYAARFPAQQAVDGERIPRLADVLTLVRTRGGGRVRVSIEVKTFAEQPDLTIAPELFAQAVQRDLQRTVTAAMVLIMAFDWRVLSAMQRLMPEVATCALTAQQPGEDTVRIGAATPSPWLGGLDPRTFDGSVTRLVKASRAGTWGPDFRDLSAELVSQAHTLGLRVVPWTVNEPDDMERILKFKVDGITTDRPDLLRELLANKGLPVPVP
jgi:glycerophosphoryl diester phosphodiesterase